MIYLSLPVHLEAMLSYTFGGLVLKRRRQQAKLRLAEGGAWTINLFTAVVRFDHLDVTSMFTHSILIATRCSQQNLMETLVSANSEQDLNNHA